MLFGQYDGKYKALTEHLVAQGAEPCTMTFSEIEKVLGFELPVSARTHAAWWANQLRGQSLAWVVVSRKTSNVSIDQEHVTFLRLDDPDVVSDVEPTSSESLGRLLNEAKARLARTIGVDASQIDITIRA
jgi:hypothetical protein